MGQTQLAPLLENCWNIISRFTCSFYLLNLISLTTVSNFFAKNLEPVDWADAEPEPTLSNIKCNIMTPFRPDKEGINIVLEHEI